MRRAEPARPAEQGRLGEVGYGAKIIPGHIRCGRYPRPELPAPSPKTAGTVTTAFVAETERFAWTGESASGGSPPAREGRQPAVGLPAQDQPLVGGQLWAGRRRRP